MIWQHPAWPKFHWEDEKIAGPKSRVRRAFDALAERIRLLPSEESLELEASIFTTEIMASSTMAELAFRRIDVLKSVNARLFHHYEPTADTFQRQDGFLEVLLDASSLPIQPLNGERLKEWHTCLFPDGIIGSDSINVGRYRKQKFDRSSPDVFIPGRISFYDPPPAKAIKSEMSAFESWFNGDIIEKTFVAPAIALLWFELLLPFEGGNGVIGCAICDLAITKETRIPHRLISLSPTILKHRAMHQLQMERVKGGDLNITSWLWWFYEMMHSAIQDAEQLATAVIRKTEYWNLFSTIELNERQRFMLEYYMLITDETVTAEQWAKDSGCTEATARRDIQYLCHVGMMERIVAETDTVEYVATGTHPKRHRFSER